MKINNTKTMLTFIIFNKIVIHAKEYNILLENRNTKKKKTKLTSLYRLACELSNKKSIIRFSVTSICIVTFFFPLA